MSEESLVTTLLERGASMSGKLMDGLTDHLTVCGIERLRRVHKNHRESVHTHTHTHTHTHIHTHTLVL